MVCYNTAVHGIFAFKVLANNFAFVNVKHILAIIGTSGIEIWSLIVWTKPCHVTFKIVTNNLAFVNVKPT